jgi:hypothetical protein
MSSTTTASCRRAGLGPSHAGIGRGVNPAAINHRRELGAIRRGGDRLPPQKFQGCVRRKNKFPVVGVTVILLVPFDVETG